MPDGAALICAGDNEFIRGLRSSLTGLFDESDIIPVSLKAFPDREVYAQLQDNVRRKIAFVFWNFGGYDGTFDPNVGYQWLHVINDATRRASAAEINDMLPFMPYLRQDRKDKPRVPITARLMAKHLEADGVDRVVTVEPHTEQVQGFFDIPVDTLPIFQLYGEEFFENNTEKKYVLVAPDVGAMKRARSLKNWLQRKYGVDMPLAMTEKTRGTDDQPEVYYLVGDPKHVEGATVIMFDDMIDTANTLVASGNFLMKEYNVAGIIACGTHGIFSHDGKISAEEKLKKSGIRVITTDSVPRKKEYIQTNSDWLTVKPLGHVFAEAAKKIYRGESVSGMYDCF